MGEFEDRLREVSVDEADYEARLYRLRLRAVHEEHNSHELVELDKRVRGLRARGCECGLLVLGGEDE